MGSRTIFIACGLLFLGAGLWIWGSEANWETGLGDESQRVVYAQGVIRLKPKFRIRFSIAEDHFHRKTLFIDETGRCEVRLESNLRQPDIPEIGRYVTGIGPDEADKLLHRVLELADEPVPKEQLPPGVPLMEVVLERGGERHSRTFDPHTVPKRFQVIGRKLREIEDEARKNLEIGLRLDFDLGTKEIERDKPIDIKLMLTGIGSGPISFYNPLLPPKNGLGRITLSGVRSDIRAEKRQFFHKQACQLGKPQWKNKGDDLSDDQTVIDLQPQESCLISFAAILDWPPGPYEVNIILESVGPSEAYPNLIIGKISSRPLPLTITGRGKKEDEGATHYVPPKL